MAEEELFPGLEQGLMSAQQHQQHLARAVESGQLWMEEGVAEKAAQVCDRTVDGFNVWLDDADVLTQRLPFGDNHDGNATAETLALAGTKYIEVMQEARTLFERMAATYRAAGRSMEQTDQDAARSFETGMQ